MTVRRCARLSAALIAFVSSQAADAAVLSEVLCKSAKNGIVNAVDLRNGFYGNKIPSAVDIDHDGTTSAEEVFANLQADTCGIDRCTDDVREQLEVAREKFAGFREFHPGLEFVELRAPTPKEIEDEPILKDPLARLLDPKSRFVALR